MTQRMVDENGVQDSAPSELRGFGQATQASPAALARVKAGLRARADAPAGRPWGLALGLALPLAAAVLLWLRAGSPVPEGGDAPGAAAVAEALPRTPISGGLEGAPLLLEPVPGLRLAVAGQGELSGTTRAPILRLRSGSVRVEVDPAAGLAVSVQTQELQVEVLGTIFDVKRDAMGASVQVERGRVAASCGAASPVALGAGQRQDCAPTTAAGMLARARGLQERGSALPEAGAAVLEAVEAGLAMPDGSPGVRGELLVVAFEVRDRAGEVEAALAAVDAYLAVGGPRAGELAARGAELALAQGGCAAAQAYAQAAAASGTLARDAAPRACLPR